MKTFIGVDPGKNGAIAVKTVDHPIGGEAMVRVETYEMPKTEYDMLLLFRALRTSHCRALIEKVNCMPGQGVSSVWTFSGNYHGLRMAMVAAGIVFDEVLPRMWQKAMGIPAREKTETKVQHKNKLKAKAQQLFPDLGVTLANADALLIMEHLSLSHPSV